MTAAGGPPLSAARPGVRRAMTGLLGLGVAIALTACGESSTPVDPLAERGRQVYLSQCTQCHAPDPAQAGAVGPPVQGASLALLEAKVLRGEYPDGYSPKRPTRVMPPMPTLAPDIGALGAYLRGGVQGPRPALGRGPGEARPARR